MSSASCFAQEKFNFSAVGADEARESSRFLFHIPQDLKAWAQQTFAPDNLYNLTGVLGMTGVLIATDYETWRWSAYPVQQSRAAKKAANIGVSIGDGFFQFSIVGAFLGAGTIFSDNRSVRTAFQITEAILTTGLIVQLIKRTTGRESPFSSEERTGRWRPFPDQREYNKDFQKFDAVPSGHLSTATTTLFVIMRNYPEHKWIPYIGYPILGLVAYGLVGTGIHWWSDFPIAVALGYQFADIVTRANSNKSSQETSVSVATNYFPRPSVMLAAEGAPIVNLHWDWTW